MNTRMNFSFYNPTRILFGAGELNTLYIHPDGLRYQGEEYKYEQN